MISLQLGDRVVQCVDDLVNWEGAVRILPIQGRRQEVLIGSRHKTYIRQVAAGIGGREAMSFNYFALLSHRICEKSRRSKVLTP